MKSLKIFLEQREWNILDYKEDTTYLNAEYKNIFNDYRLIVSKTLGVNSYYKTEWYINGETYTITSNKGVKFIFNELNNIGFK